MRSSIFALFLAPQLVLASAADFQKTEHEGTVAWAALVKPGKEADLSSAVAKLGKAQRAALSANGIVELNFYTELIGDRRCLIATHHIRQDLKADANWVDILRAKPESARWLDQVEACIDPHPRFAASAMEGTAPSVPTPKDSSRHPGSDGALPSKGDHNQLWARCETICQLRPDVPAKAKAKVTTYAAITELRPEKEAEYRDLHSHVWPGVIDAIGDSNISRFDLYLIEFGDSLYLVYSFDYRGTNFDADMAKMAANPVNKRWWKYTDSCQKALPQTPKGIWETMEPVPAVAPTTAGK